MDPNTVVIILALNLIATGGLFRLISRKMPPRSGLALFGAGAIAFGLAYVARLLVGLQGPPVVSGLMDTTMILGALLFTIGVRQFVGQPAFRPQVAAMLLLLYAATIAVAVARWGAVGRHVLLNESLGLIYGALAIAAVTGLRAADTSAIRAAYRMLAVLMGLLALLTAARGLVIAVQGVGAIASGLAAQVYYAYAALAVMLLGPNLLWMVFLRLNRQLTELASRDALTHALNRNGLTDALRHHFGGRAPQPICWLQADIDHFKRINDLHGHAAGDAVLREVASAFARLVRGQDLVARTGGEEFLIGCVGGTAKTARDLGERLREGVADLQLRAPGTSEAIACTISVGVSEPFSTMQDWEVAAQRADMALYVAKASGRNRVAFGA